MYDALLIVALIVHGGSLFGPCLFNINLVLVLHSS